MPWRTCHSLLMNDDIERRWLQSRLIKWSRIYKVKRANSCVAISFCSSMLWDAVPSRNIPGEKKINIGFTINKSSMLNPSHNTNMQTERLTKSKPRLPLSLLSRRGSESFNSSVTLMPVPAKITNANPILNNLKYWNPHYFEENESTDTPGSPFTNMD